MKKTNQKTVVVTGGAGLLGKEFISALAKNNFIAISADVNSKKDDIKKSFSTDFISIDITSESSVKNAISHINKKYGRIDALVNNAYPRNKNYGRKFENVSYRDFCENVNMHLGGYFLTSKLFAGYFKKQGSGNIINMASIYGVMAPRFEIYEGTDMTMPVEYAVIKSAVIHLTKYMAKYFKGKNIRVNCISPGGIFNHQPKKFVSQYSKFSLNKKMLSASDLSGTLLFMLSDDSASINGQNIIVDGGWAL